MDRTAYYNRFLEKYDVLETITLPDITMKYVSQDNKPYILIECPENIRGVVVNSLHKMNSIFIPPIESEYKISETSSVHRYISPTFHSKPFYSLKNFISDYDSSNASNNDKLYTVVIKDLLSILLVFHSNNCLFNSFDINKFYLDDTYDNIHLKYIGFYPTYKYNSKMEQKHSYPLISNEFSDPELNEVFPPLFTFDLYSYGKFVYYLITGDKNIDKINDLNEYYENHIIYNRYISIIKSVVESDRQNRDRICKVMRDSSIVNFQMYANDRYHLQLGPRYYKFEHLLKDKVNKSFYGTLKLSKIKSYLLYCNLNGICFDIHIDPETVHNNIFIRCTDTMNYIPLIIGMKVIRGPNWKVENNDIDGNYFGIVEYINEYNTSEVYVRWNHSKRLTRHTYSDKEGKINFEVIPAYPPLMIGEKVRSISDGSVGVVINLKTIRHPASMIYSESIYIKDYWPLIDFGIETSSKCYGESDYFEVEVDYNEYMNPNVKNSIDHGLTKKISEYIDLVSNYCSSSSQDDQNINPGRQMPPIPTISELDSKTFIPTLEQQSLVYSSKAPLSRLFTNMDHAKTNVILQSDSSDYDVNPFATSTDMKYVDYYTNMILPPPPSTATGPFPPTGLNIPPNTNDVNRDTTQTQSPFRGTVIYRNSVQGLYNNYNIGHFISALNDDTNMHSYGEITGVDKYTGQLAVKWHDIQPENGEHTTRDIFVDKDEYVECTPSNKNIPIVKIGQNVGIIEKSGVKTISITEIPDYRIIKITKHQFDSIYIIQLEKIDKDGGNENDLVEVNYITL